MVSFSHVVGCCAVLVVCVALSGSPLMALDANHDGIVDEGEVAVFAKTQGIPESEVKAEFDGLDKNHDGKLEPDELSAVVTTTPLAAVAIQEIVTPAPIQEIVTPAPQQVVPEKHVQIVSVEHPIPPANGGSINTDMEDIERDAQVQARRTLAQVFAQRAQEVLAQRSQDESQAQSLEQLARSLRANATALVAHAARQTSEAALTAARATAQNRLRQAKDLEASSQKAAAEAASKRQEAKAAMTSALKAQDQMTSLVRSLRLTEAAQIS